MAALTPGQAEYWNTRLRYVSGNPDLARALWDLARTQAGQDDALWADLARMLKAWTEEQLRRSGP
jgi:hypothetical protein